MTTETPKPGNDTGLLDETLAKARAMAEAGHSLAEIERATGVPAGKHTWVDRLMLSNTPVTPRLLGAYIGFVLGVDARDPNAVMIRMGMTCDMLKLSPGSVRAALTCLEQLGWLQPCGGNRNQGQRIYALRIPQKPVEG